MTDKKIMITDDDMVSINIEQADSCLIKAKSTSDLERRNKNILLAYMFIKQAVERAGIDYEK